MENIKDPILQIKDVCISYTSDVMAVKHVSADIEKNTITAIMGPSGCGKSTLLRAVNRMHELYKNIRVTGEILLNGENVLQMHPMEERRRIGMVFQRPNPFPTMNIYDNVLAGYILNGIHLSKSQKDEIVERNLRNVCLWDEVKDSLTKRGTFLSGQSVVLSSRADSSSACVLHVLWRFSRTSCLWTNLLQLLTRLLPSTSKD